MTDQDEPMDDEPAVPLNREQRRAQRFGRKVRDVPQDNLQPQSLNNRAFGKSDEQTNPAFGESGLPRDTATLVPDPDEVTAPEDEPAG